MMRGLVALVSLALVGVATGHEPRVEALQGRQGGAERRATAASLSPKELSSSATVSLATTSVPGPRVLRSTRWTSTAPDKIRLSGKGLCGSCAHAQCPPWAGHVRTRRPTPH